MRISFFSTSAKFSGGRLALFRHANELGRRGHEVSVWIQAEAAVVDWMDLAVPVHHFRGDRPAALPPCDVCVFDRARLGPILSRVARGPVVHFCQGFEGTDTELRLREVWRAKGLFGLNRLWKLWLRQRHTDAAYRLPTPKIVTHRHLGELIARRFGQPSHLVPYGLPPGVFGPPATRSWAGRTVLVVGPTDIGWKRVPDALRAVRLLKERLPGVRLVRVAQHPMREVERALGVTDEYHTMIQPRAIADLCGRADALLITADLTEGFGLPLLEALACGLPSVATDTPAYRSFARPDDYARFVPVGDVAGMAAALEALLNDPAERQRLSRRGPAVAADYTMDRSHDALEAVLADIVAGGTAGRLAA